MVFCCSQYYPVLLLREKCLEPKFSDKYLILCFILWKQNSTSWCIHTQYHKLSFLYRVAEANFWHWKEFSSKHLPLTFWVRCHLFWIFRLEREFFPVRLHNISSLWWSAATWKNFQWLFAKGCSQPGSISCCIPFYLTLWSHLGTLKVHPGAAATLREGAALSTTLCPAAEFLPSCWIFFLFS